MARHRPTLTPPDCGSTDGSDDACSASPVGPLEPILGGTLALLTFYARTPHLAAADKIARNLALIARHPQAGEPLQTVCARLFVDWLGPTTTHDEPAERQWRTVHPRPDAMQ
ncbi:hypothetical protein [Azohydromonas sediminis]|uniref:hypothetical protein n=1 Tax=Azohydromonas sediminis TaxID=2259674 RepID=UPI000E649FB7|nr:hypothetical protein [Azohydromonas sediminis]